MMTWTLFNLFVVGMLALDLGVFHRKAHEVRLKEALTWSGVWVALALLFNAGLYVWQGAKPAMEFLTGYVIEKSLSIDNIFVFVMVFSFLKVPPLYQHKVLFWGILSALIMRAALIAVGSTLIMKFHWMIYVFGGFLIFTGIKMLLMRNETLDPTDTAGVRLFRRLVPMTRDYRADHFWVSDQGKWHATPLFLALVVVEVTDLIFALDSIPAIFAVTADPFIVYTSNVFAILGLRSLYFALAGLIDKFCYLKIGLSTVLVFVGGKMMISEFYKVPVSVALGAVCAILGLSVIASLVWPTRAGAHRAPATPGD